MAQALTGLHDPESLSAVRGEVRHGAMRASVTGEDVSRLREFFERWLNGLVYELFFPEELARRGIGLFEETARLELAELSTLKPEEQLARLQEVAEAAEKSAIPAMLEDLAKVDEVRFIEEEVSAVPHDDQCHPDEAEDDEDTAKTS